MAHPPGDLCPAHTDLWVAWARVSYDPRRPTEWPGRQHVMDDRTTHAQRARDWRDKTAGQLAGIEATCRSGRSPQCTPRRVPAC